ncbi:MAG: DUF3592 domain-containing protein [Anaerolineae bacterium]
MEFLIVLGSGAFLLGLAIIVWIALTKRRGQGTPNWPKVPGTVVAARVVPFEHETPEGDEKTFTPLITYEYRVNGQTFESQRRNFLPGESATYQERSEAEAVVMRYPPGAPVSVSYNPANPKQAALEPPRPVAHNAVLYYGVTNLVAGALIVALGIVLLQR